ncbi:hypothetical protein FF011L_10390 [Roseimaritima multifibrata]|uniref:Uncharacterized protein n=1 Tax=Roseimaritima multifibrata TaxID=1930274 RepID=A0A517MC00_9BACT|nr:hypothetical protein [Roseimaritima multifibrata]QDS92297.1 hypothetical protein FF011L_10390 [Roseimaritima multifibrata]
MPPSTTNPAAPGTGWRRPLILVLSIVLLAVGAFVRATTDESSGHWNFGTGTLLRLGLTFGALWLAWPSLQRPASWLPAGMPFLMLVGVGVIAAQPRLVVAVVPAIGLLFALSVAVRIFRT